MTAVNAKYTPGPWVARQEFANRWRIESHASGPDYVPVSVGLACTTILEVGVNDASTAANARLIASAPDLVEALRGVAGLRSSIRTWALSNQIPGWQNADDLFAAIDAALSKAGV